ncbi:MAG TPA: isoaspartyl peptidase/L-asparaginase [Aliidongia sp.]|uniref:isoaspartyl peptidase/L-asparaginase family protein n=1 Tax=Aliidongia sp. TaxID=1914230 RepID=UPI002DDD1994|nr:isoaspartyl peptidase/L-asparaginase [Aliidongia sp.]HEV2673821.1 isoaspartyl peptidase/L-asparaginase [Aliidongia sp.]
MVAYTLAVHGGAGTIDRAALTPDLAAAYHAGLRHAIEQGAAVLAGGGSALDAVTAAVVALEDCPLFNAGKGAVLNADARHELDSAIMEGTTRRAGALAAVTRVRNPILGARLVMERSGHVLMAGADAERFLSAQGMELVAPEYFTTPERLAQLRRVQADGRGVMLDHDGQSVTDRVGTVGAVALDTQGRLAAATSTGGMTNKRPGRVGDTPVIGAGCYADDATAAVSTTGTGEAFIRAVAAYDVAARMAYGGSSLADAAERVVEGLPGVGGQGGLIALDRSGALALPFNTSGMYRGYLRAGAEIVTAIHR